MGPTVDMKMILALTLATLAAAEPDAKADADAYYGYGLGHLGYGGYRTYGLGYGHGFYYGKREAEAEAKPEAEPYYYGGYYGLGHLGYGSYRTYGYGGHFYGKREAEPFVYAHYPAVHSVHSYGVPAAVPAVAGGYAAAGRYVANSAGVVHIAKREAEADAEPYYYSGYHGLGYGGYDDSYLNISQIKLSIISP